MPVSLCRICCGQNLFWCPSLIVVVMLLSLQTLAYRRSQRLTYPEMATAACFLKWPGWRGFHVFPEAHKDFRSYLIPS